MIKEADVPLMMDGRAGFRTPETRSAHNRIAQPVTPACLFPTGPLSLPAHEANSRWNQPLSKHWFGARGDRSDEENKRAGWRE